MAPVARTIAKLISLAAVVTMMAGIQTANAGKFSYRPDGQIRGGPADSTYLGDNLYNDTATGQTKTRLLRPTGSDGYHFLAQNDSGGTDYFYLHGDGSSAGFKVSYFSGTTNITADVEAGTYLSSPLDSDESQEFSVWITAKKSASQGDSKTVEIVETSYYDSFQTDTVAARAIVKKSGGDAGGLSQT